jgi:hypothetical protein
MKRTVVFAANSNLFMANSSFGVVAFTSLVHGHKEEGRKPNAGVKKHIDMAKW